MSLVVGAVAYDAKVVPIWTGFRAWLRDQDVDYDYVLYSNYERQVDDLIAGHIDAAWNSPLAWLRARRLAETRGVGVVPAVMRDTDRDLTSVIVVRADARYERLADLKGERVAVGAVDSPQATLMPLALLRGHGAVADDGDILGFDIGVGLHGDHIGGEQRAEARSAQTTSLSSKAQRSSGPPASARRSCTPPLPLRRPAPRRPPVGASSTLVSRPPRQRRSPPCTLQLGGGAGILRCTRTRGGVR